MSAHPAPLTPADADLQDFPFMPLHVARLRDSDLAAEESPEACWYAVLLWAASWHQLPAGSLPDNDAILMRLAGLGRDARTWKKNRSGALRGFVQCSDGRLYHPVVAEQVNSAWAEKLAYRDRREKRKSAGTSGADSKWDVQASDGLTRSQRLAAAREKGRHTKAQWLALVEACGAICGRCGDGGALVKDHILPIYKGGSDAIDNLQPLCTSCNSSKGPETTDHRPDGWRDAYERLANAWQNAPDGDAERLLKERGTERGTGTGNLNDDVGASEKIEFDWPADALELSNELTRLAGVPNVQPSSISRNLTVVQDWLKDGMDPAADIVPVISQVLLDTTDRISSLRFFDGAVRQAKARAAASAAGGKPSKAPSKPLTAEERIAQFERSADMMARMGRHNEAQEERQKANELRQTA